MKVKTLIRQLLQCRRQVLKTEYHDSPFGKYWLDKSLNVEVKEIGGKPRQIKSVKLKRPGYFSGGTVVEITLSSKFDNI